MGKLYWIIPVSDSDTLNKWEENLQPARYAGKGRVKDMNEQRPLYIFDLDGTLALCQHRLHLIDANNEEKRWREFYEACDQDPPNVPLIKLLNRLRMTNAEIWIFTGRSNIVRAKTERWLFQHTSLSIEELDRGLNMRCDGDFRHDDELKEAWLQTMISRDRERIVMVFEDRDRVVEMWRRNGVTCLQVANGKF